MITVIGLGVEKGDITLAAIAKMKEADEVLVRTARLPSAEGVKEAGIPFESLDCLYEHSRSYDSLTRKIAGEVRRRAKGRKVCYCVDGSVSEDRAALMLSSRGAEVIEGVPKAARAAALTGLGCSYTSVSAYEISERKLTLPLVVYDFADRQIASDVKLALTEAFGDEAEAYFVVGNRKKKIRLYEADRQKSYGEHALLCVPEIPLLKRKRFDLDDLMEILRRLRAPDGCPWDKVQTHESIRINAIEEAYELVDAIDCDSPEKMCEEAGDVIMQAAFHTLMEEERGNFNLTDVLSGLCEKLITRHTHVFGQDSAANADGALSVWDKNKMAEKGQTTYSDAVNDVPACFPALLRAQKVCKRMAKGGWKFNDFNANLNKLNEEAEELRAAYEAGDSAAVSDELGDVLMVVAQMGRMVGGDCEQALLDSVKKVASRYTAWEALVLKDGKDPNALTEKEWTDYYERAKRNVERA